MKYCCIFGPGSLLGCGKCHPFPTHATHPTPQTCPGTAQHPDLSWGWPPFNLKRFGGLGGLWFSLGPQFPDRLNQFQPRMSGGSFVRVLPSTSSSPVPHTLEIPIFLAQAGMHDQEAKRSGLPSLKQTNISFFLEPGPPFPP